MRTLFWALLLVVLTTGFAGSALAQFTITLQPNSLPVATNGTPYSQTITAVGGNAPYTFSLLSGSLPAGLSLDSAGNLTGTPTASGSPTFEIQADDVGGNSGFRTYQLFVGTVGGIDMSPGTLPDGSQGVAYSQTITGTGGTGPYTFSVTSGSFPTGLTLSSGGVLSGTPTVPGPFTFTVGDIDSHGNTGSHSYTVNIGANILTVNPATLANGALATPYSQTVTATGGTGPYTFAVSAGSLPTGLSLASNGNITGTPTVAGPFTFTVRAIDSVNNTGTRSYTVNVGSNILTVTPSSPLPNGTRGQAYGATFGASGGTGPYSFQVRSGSLPGGLSLSSSGALSGTPTVAGTFSFDVQATDSLFNTGTGSYSLTIDPAPLTINPATLANGTIGTAYSQSVTASNGTPAYSYAVIAGGLPTGLSLNTSNGAITGTPTTPGSYSFTIQATDATPVTGSRNYTVLVGSNVLTIAPASLRSGTQGVAYTQTLTTTGGNGSYTYAVTAGALPAGLSLNTSSGVISGTPTGTGTASFTIGVTDTAANIGSRVYSMNIGTVSLIVNPATLPAAIAGRPYSQNVTASGGTGPYTYSIAAGALPPGLTLNAATGLISGTPTGLAVASFTVQAVDVNGNTGNRAFTITNRPDPALDPEVQGLIASQVATTQRFASAQIDNVTQHLAGLHGHFNPCSFNFGIAPPIDRTGQYGNPVVSKDPYSGPPPGYYPPYGAPGYGPPPARGLSGTPDCAADWASSMAFWTAGSFQFGSSSANGIATNNKFVTGGVTGGADLRVSDDLIVGVALGYGADRSDIGQNGSRSDATSFSGTLYASMRPFDPFFLDASIGYGTLGFDNRRFVTGEGSLVSGSRRGSYWFGSLSASLELGNGPFKFAPYVSTDFMSATLDNYSENGSSAQLLTFNDMNVHSFSSAVGLRGSIDIPMGFGTLTPTARVEYREISQGDYSQAMYYSDLGAASASAFGQPSAVNGMTTGAIGFRARTPGGLSFELEYGFSTGTNSYKAQTIRAVARVPF